MAEGASRWRDLMRIFGSIQRLLWRRNILLWDEIIDAFFH
mgnify:CR=1 FL=1